MSKSQDRQKGVNKGELTERVIEPAKGIGRALRKQQERQQYQDERKRKVEELRKQREEQKMA